MISFIGIGIGGSSSEILSKDNRFRLFRNNELGAGSIISIGDLENEKYYTCKIMFMKKMKAEVKRRINDKKSEDPYLKNNNLQLGLYKGASKWTKKKKKKGCLSLLIKGILIYFILGGIFAFIMSNCAKKDHNEALNETTTFMNAGDYDAAIERLDEYWKEYDISNHTDLADLYIQCFKAEKRYEEAANIVISIFQKQGYEDPVDGKLHTRLAEILPKLSQESQDQIQKVLDELPDSLEEKERLEEEQKEAAEKAEQEAKAQKEAKAKAAAQAEAEQKDREILQSAFNGSLTEVDTRDRIRELCNDYLEN